MFDLFLKDSLNVIFFVKVILIDFYIRINFLFFRVFIVFCLCYENGFYFFFMVKYLFFVFFNRVFLSLRLYFIYIFIYWVL